MDITNKSKKPLTVPLPGGKKLFLGPGKTGQISPKAAARPAIQKLIEAGDIEVADAKRSSGEGGTSSSSAMGRPASGASRAQGGAMRQSGDR